MAPSRQCLEFGIQAKIMSSNIMSKVVHNASSNLAACSTEHLHERILFPTCLSQSSRCCMRPSASIWLSPILPTQSFSKSVEPASTLRDLG